MWSLIFFFVNSACFVTCVLNMTDQNKILELQNEMRSEFALVGYKCENRLRHGIKASDMRQLKWDTRLSLSATVLADQRPTSISTTKRLEGYTFIRLTCILSDWLVTVADMWLRRNQFRNYVWHPKNLTQHMFETMGNAMQILWAKSSKIGCATKQWIDDYGCHSILVCKYDKPVQLNAPVYREGEPCTHCPRNSVCNLTMGLCNMI